MKRLWLEAVECGKEGLKRVHGSALPGGSPVRGGGPVGHLVRHGGSPSRIAPLRHEPFSLDRESAARNPLLDGFSLMELLVAMAVLAIILVMMLQVVNGLLQSTRAQSQKVESSATGRQALDVMATDIRNAVVGETASILAPTTAGNPLLALLVARRGPAGSSSPRFLAVSYSMTNNQLFRAYGGVDYSQTNLIAAALTAPSPPVEPLAKGILAVQIRAFTDTTNFPITTAASANWATNSYNTIPVPSGWQALVPRGPVFSSALTNRVRALEVWVAAIDGQNFQLLPNGFGLTNADPGLWRSEVDGSAIPAQPKAAIQILNKTLPMP